MENGIYNLEDIARLLGRQPKTIRAWIDKGCPVVEAGGSGKPWQLNLADIVQWREQRISEQATQTRDDPELDEARRRKLVAAAKLAELALEKARGEVMPADAVLTTWQSLVLNFRAKMRAIPNTMAPRLAIVDTPGEIFSILDQHIDNALKELSEQDMTDILLVEASEY